MAVEDFISPFGYSGFSDPDAHGLPPAPEPPIVLADDIDPTTGEFISFDGVHPVDAHVRYQFQVQAGTGAAVGRVGHRLFENEYINDTTESAIRIEAKRIFSLLGAEWAVLKPASSGDKPVRVVADGETQLAYLVVDYENALAKRSDEIRRKLEG